MKELLQELWDEFTGLIQKVDNIVCDCETKELLSEVIGDTKKMLELRRKLVKAGIENIPDARDFQTTPRHSRPLTQEEYLQPDAGCPMCQATDIEYGAFNVVAADAIQEATCQRCSASWTDVYTLSSYDNLISE